MEKKFAKYTLVYRHDAAYARKHDELPQYRAPIRPISPARQRLRKQSETITKITA